MLNSQLALEPRTLPWRSARPCVSLKEKAHLRYGDDRTLALGREGLSHLKHGCSRAWLGLRDKVGVEIKVRSG